jgi:hypothetical protein
MPGRRRRRGLTRVAYWAAHWALFCWLIAAPLHATSLRVGEHDGFSRVVFSVTPGVTQSVTPDSDKLLLHLAGAGAVPGAARGLRNVKSIEGGQDQAVLLLSPGCQPRIWRTGALIVVDIYSPGVSPPGAPISKKIATPQGAAAPVAPREAAHRAETPHAAQPEFTLVPVEQAPLPPPAKSANHADSAPAPATPPAAVPGATPKTVPAPALPPAGADAGESLVAERLPDDAVLGEAAILVPFDSMVAAAAFPRGGLAHVIFDDSKPVDLAALKDDPVFGSARVTLLPAATHLTLRMPDGAALRLQHRKDGWVIAVRAGGRAGPSAELKAQEGALAIGTPQPADTIVMDDKATGGRLLVGTVLGEGPGVAVPHVSAEFSVLPSWAGVLVAANSDRLSLRAGSGAFVLSAASGPALSGILGGSAALVAEAAALTRHFDFPPLPTPALLTRLRAALHAAAAAPRLNRLAPRLQTAQAMLALGLDREAGGSLRAAQQDDPAQATTPDEAALLAMADWLAGLDAGIAFNDPTLGKSDEIALWRGLTAPATADQRQQAAAVAATWRLLLAYPEPLRRRLLRPAAETMLQGGQEQAADDLMAKLPDPTLDDLRAASLMRHHRDTDALVLLDKVAAASDRRRAAEAARQAIELRLAAHLITPSQAATALDSSLYAWRSDPVEIAQRLRIAVLRTQSGEWRRALALLHDTDTLFPAAHEQMRQAEVAVMTDLLRAGQAQRLSPLDLVALVDENADLLAGKEASATLAPVLIDKLLALDLPSRAEPILARLMAATDTGEPKATLGGRLAALRLENGDTAGATVALQASEAPDLGPALQTTRAVLHARILAESGQEDAALAVLADMTDQDALQLRARLLENRKDWHGAEAVLRALVHATVPAQGALSVSQQDLILRAASAAAQAGDIAVLRHLQDDDGGRMDAGPRSALFKALAQQPVQSLTDLPRSGREAEAARAVPAALASFEGH